MARKHAKETARLNPDLRARMLIADALADLLQIDVMSATVQDQVWGSTWRDDGGLEFKFSNHGFEVGLRMGGLPTRRACTSRGGAGPSLEGGVVGGGDESDAHALQRAKRLTDTLDFLLTGLLLPHGRADGISNAG